MEVAIGIHLVVVCCGLAYLEGQEVIHTGGGLGLLLWQTNCSKVEDCHWHPPWGGMLWTCRLSLMVGHAQLVGSQSSNSWFMATLSSQGAFLHRMPPLPASWTLLALFCNMASFSTKFTTITGLAEFPPLFLATTVTWEEILPAHPGEVVGIHSQMPLQCILWPGTIMAPGTTTVTDWVDSSTIIMGWGHSCQIDGTSNGVGTFLLLGDIT